MNFSVRGGPAVLCASVWVWVWLCVQLANSTHTHLPTLCGSYLYTHDDSSASGDPAVHVSDAGMGHTGIATEAAVVVVTMSAVARMPVALLQATRATMMIIQTLRSPQAGERVRVRAYIVWM
jgi:hypothetical protein